MTTKRTIVSVKDPNGAYIGREVVTETKPPETPHVPNIPDDLDAILKHQITALARLTRMISTEIAAGNVTKETPNQLATCIKITMELKAKEKALLDELDDEALLELSKA